MARMARRTRSGADDKKVMDIANDIDIAFVLFVCSTPGRLEGADAVCMESPTYSLTCSLKATNSQTI